MRSLDLFARLAERPALVGLAIVLVFLAGSAIEWLLP